MPSINLRLSDEEHAALLEWAHGSRRSLQREIVFRLFAGGVLAERGVADTGRAVGADAAVRNAAAASDGDGSALASGSADVPRSASTPEAKPCARAFAHHNYHAGKPCPHCGYPA